MQPDALAVEGDLLRSHALGHRVVAVHLDRRVLLRDRQRLDSLTAVIAGQVGDEALKDERAAGLQDACDVAQAVRLAVSVGQVKQRVEDQVHEPERPLRRYVGHVTDDHGDPITVRFGPKSLHHRLRRLDTLDRDPAGGQWKPDPTGPDRELEHAPPARQSRQERHRWGWIERRPLVIDIRPPVTEERRIIKRNHAATQARSRRGRLAAPDARAAPSREKETRGKPPDETLAPRPSESALAAERQRRY